MTKNELLVLLAEKFSEILGIELVDSLGPVSWYTANVFDIDGIVASRSNVGFYVVNEGQPEEAAYWTNAEPKPEPITSFRDEVLALIGQKIDALEIEGAYIENIDAANETAICRVFRETGADPSIEEIRVFMDRDELDALRYRLI